MTKTQLKRVEIAHKTQSNLHGVILLNINVPYKIGERLIKAFVEGKRLETAGVRIKRSDKTKWKEGK